MHFAFLIKIITSVKEHLRPVSQVADDRCICSQNKVAAIIDVDPGITGGVDFSRPPKIQGIGDVGQISDTHGIIDGNSSGNIDIAIDLAVSIKNRLRAFFGKIDHFITVIVGAGNINVSVKNQSSLIFDGFVITVKFQQHFAFESDCWIGTYAEFIKSGIIGTHAPIVKSQFTAAGNGDVDETVISDKINFALDFFDGDIGVVLQGQLPDSPFLNPDFIHLETFFVIKNHFGTTGFNMKFFRLESDIMVKIDDRILIHINFIQRPRAL